MPPRYIVRPRGILTTPKKLKEVLGARYTISHDRPKRFAEDVDFFLAYPSILPVGCSTPFAFLSQFARSDKATQRKILHDCEIPVPRTRGIHSYDLVSNLGNGPWVIRPLRHRGGQGWRISDDYDYDHRTEYCAELFPKKYEYRVIYCRGQKVSTLIKRVPPSLSNSDPWNFANGCSFETVNSADNDRLRHTDCYEKLGELSLIQKADLVAADILMDQDRRYVVCELNFAPAISIPSTLDKIRTIVNAE